MSKDKKEKKTEEQAPLPPLMEVLIQVAVDHATKSGMKLGEVVGHFEIAKVQIYQRNIDAIAAQAAAEQAQTPAVPAEGADKEGEVVSFQDEAEGKAEK